MKDKEKHNLQLPEEAAQPDLPQEAPPENLQDLNHDLHVHLIESEMQNEELHRLRQELELEKDRFTALYDYAPVGYLTLDVEGIIIQTNLTLVTMLGVDRSHLIQQPLSQFIHREDHDNYYLKRWEFFKTPEPKTCELKMVRKDGSHFWTRMDAVAAQDNDNQTVCRVTISDITERVVAEEALRESGTRWQSLTMSSPDYILILDKDLRIQFLNYAAPGLTVEELIGTPLYTYVEEERQTEIKAILEGVLRSGAAATYETTYNQPDGSTIYYESHATPRRLPDNEEIIGLTLVSRDRTQQKQAELELQQRAEELTALREIMLELTAQHDLSILLHLIVERAARLLGVDSGGMYLCDSGRQEVTCVVSYNTPSDYTAIVLKYGEGAAGVVAQTGEALVIDDYHVWPGRAAVFEEEEQPFSAMLSVPMVWQEQVLGIIQVLHTQEGRRFTFPDLGLLSLFANQAAIAVQNARLLDRAQNEISERKQAEEVLQEREEKYRNLFNNAEVGMFRTRLDGSEILDMNDKFLEIFGRTREEMRGRSSVIHWADPREREEMTRRLNIEGRVANFECKMLNKQGEVRICLTSLRLYPDQSILEGSILDITERKKAEEALRVSLEETIRTQRLLIALNQAAQAVQQAHTADEVFRTIGEGMTAIGFQCGVLTLTEDRTHLAISLFTHKSALLERATKLTGLSPVGYRFPLKSGGIFERCLNQQETIYSEGTVEHLAETLPGAR